ncbi:Uma2 family endonuclease, partial [Spirulina sp. CS-785/01]|nr:Uma2 family endonuclease [Spirulina sp. CS-785/01]
SPRLGIRFVVEAGEMEIYKPNGERFLSFVELNQLREEEKQRAEEEKQRAEEEKQRAEEEKQRADQLNEELQQERDRYQQLREKLAEQGIDPDTI